jgi:hypothetical protein
MYRLNFHNDYYLIFAFQNCKLTLQINKQINKLLCIIV